MSSHSLQNRCDFNFVKSAIRWRCRFYWNDSTKYKNFRIVLYICPSTVEKLLIIIIFIKIDRHALPNFSFRLTFLEYSDLCKLLSTFLFASMMANHCSRTNRVNYFNRHALYIKDAHWNIRAKCDGTCDRPFSRKSQNIRNIRRLVGTAFSGKLQSRIGNYNL